MSRSSLVDCLESTIRWTLTAEYESERSCGDYDGDYSSCEDICRCTRYYNARIDKISHNDVKSIAEAAMAHGKNMCESYCFGRIVMTDPDVSNPSNYTVDVIPGYYGDEIDNIRYDKISNLIEKLDRCASFATNAEKLKFALECENGYLLPKLKYCDFVVDRIAFGDIKIGNSEHYHRLDSDRIELYKGEVPNDGFPKCIVDQNSTLIDGYHRYTALNKVASPDDMVNVWRTV